ncbi:MAG: ArnT family glycosyltransferase [Candidatus Binatia bacterium]
MKTGRFFHPVIVAVAAAATLLPLLGQTRVVSRHEIRHAEIAREMAISGDFLFPRLLGEPYRDKPPVLSAATALAYRLAGEPSIALARAPSAAAAIAAALVLYAIGCALADRRTALWAALAMIGVQGMQQLGRTARPDMLFTLALLLSCLASLSALGRRDSRGRLGGFALAGAAAAVATLVKGPLAWAFSLLFPIVIAAQRSDLRSPRLLDWLAFVTGLAITAAIWAVPVYLRDHGEYLRSFLTQPDLTTWTLGASLGRIHRPWMYSLAGFLPLTLLLPALVRDVRRRALGPAATIALGMLVILSVIPKKRIHYQLPVYPFLALAVAETAIRAGGARFVGFVFRGLVVLALIAGPLYFAAVLPWLEPDEDVSLAVARKILRSVEPGPPILCLGDIAEAIAFVGRRDDVSRAADAKDLGRRLHASGPGAYLLLPAEQAGLARELAGDLAGRNAPERIAEVRDGAEAWTVYRMDSTGH